MIFIRRVEGGKNDNNRFEMAFKDVPNDKWSSFSDANELPEKLYDDEDPINQNNKDDDDDDFDSLNHAVILSMSLLYYILPILLTLFFTMIYV
jgi:hypothetical protein